MKQVSITTLEIAERTGKLHSRVLALLTWYLKSFGNEGITEYYYRKENNKTYKAYLVNENVITCLVWNGALPPFKF